VSAKTDGLGFIFLPSKPLRLSMRFSPAVLNSAASFSSIGRPIALFALMAEK
jgi:hypothetical protein